MSVDRSPKLEGNGARSSKEYVTPKEPLTPVSLDNHDVEELETTKELHDTNSASTVHDLEKAHTRTSKTSKRDRVLQEVYPETNLEEGLVGWDCQDDPKNPRNFTTRRKALILGLVSVITFVSPLASSMLAPGITFVLADFHETSTVLAAFAVSVFILGFALGPLVLSPLSELYGRYLVLTLSNVFFAVWQLGCALAPNMTTLIISRLFAGIGGSACLTVGAGVIADLYEVQYRGAATGFFSLGPLMGPNIAPIAGGFLAQRAGWRWVFWLLLILASLLTALIAIMQRETNASVLLEKKTRRMQKELNRPELRSCLAGDQATSAGRHLWHSLIRPIRLFFGSAIMFILSIYMSVVYGMLYLLFTTITLVFQDSYGWDPDLTGLAYLGIGLGFLLGMAIVAKTNDATIVRLTKRNGGKYEPEMRLPTMVFFAMCIPISLFWYGWSVQYKVHWIVPILGLTPFGIGMMGIFLPIQTYTIDAFTQYAASAVATLSFTRSIFGAFLPLAGERMYQTLGYGWGNSLLGFIALALIPAPAVIFKFGKRIREQYPVKLD